MPSWSCRAAVVTGGVLVVVVVVPAFVAWVVGGAVGTVTAGDWATDAFELTDSTGRLIALRALAVATLTWVSGPPVRGAGRSRRSRRVKKPGVVIEST